MKTLLNNKRSFRDASVRDERKGLQVAPPQQSSSSNRITSAYIASKIIKGLPIMMPTKQMSPPQQFQSYQPRLIEATIREDPQDSKQTQSEAADFLIRAQSAPENAIRKHREIKDLKDLLSNIQRHEPQEEEVFVQNKFPSYINNFGEFSINPHVHKHLQRIKSSKLSNYSQMPKNMSSKLERQRDVIEKSLPIRPIQSQQGKRRVIVQQPQRPKTSNFFSQQQPQQSKIASATKLPMQDQWMILTQKALQTKIEQQNSNVKIDDKELTHLDLETNTLTNKEREYIKKKRNHYLDDIRPYIEQVQQKAEQRKQMGRTEVLLDKLDQHNTLLSELDNGEQFIADEDSFDVLEDEIQILNDPVMNQNPLFSKADQLNDSLTELLKETQTKYKLMEQQDRNVWEQQKKLKQDLPEPSLKVADRLTIDELRLVLREIDKPVDDRNYQLLDSITKQLKFFWQFSRPTRILLLQLSKIEKYESGDYVFHEGEQGEQMYIILKGACHVRIRTPHSDATNNIYGPVISTLYDGQQFGELALIDPKKTKIQKPDTVDFNSQKKYQSLAQCRKEMGYKEAEVERSKNWWKKDYTEKQEEAAIPVELKRSASIEAAEITYLMAISREHFQSIILNVITQELEDKLKTLLVMPCFDLLSQMELIPIANQLQSQKFRLGQVILKEGEPQKYFYIVASGRCKLIKEEVFIRDMKSLGHVDQKLKHPIKTGLIDYGHKQDSNRDRMLLHKVDLSGVEGPPIVQSFQYQEIFNNKEYKAFKYHFHYGDFVRGDFFMGRALLSEFKQFDEEIQELKYDVDEPSRLTVISDAAVTEVYKLEKSMLHLIPMPLKQFLIDGIKSREEFDIQFTYEEAQRAKKWDAYKVKLFRNIVDNKSINK